MSSQQAYGLFMPYENRTVAGSLVFVAGFIGVLGIIVAEALYPGYSTANNDISDLGVGPSAIVFNSALVILGILVLCDAYFVQKAFNVKVFTVLVAMAGIGAAGVGLFTEHTGVVHTVFSFITFFFAGLSAIASFKVLKRPFSYLSVTVGVATLLAMILFESGTHLGIGKGGMERMIVYPALLWTVGFGGYLMGHSAGEKTESHS